MKPIIIAIITSILLFSACDNSFQYELTKDNSTDFFNANKGSSLIADTTTNTSTLMGIGVSSSGFNAAYKKFTGQKAAIDESRFIRFELKGFMDDIEIKKSTTNSSIEMVWSFLAESQAIVDEYADITIPRIDNTNPEFDVIIFEQLKNCKGYSRVEINGQPNYNVVGTCIYPPYISIPEQFKNKVFVNGKLVHDPTKI